VIRFAGWPVRETRAVAPSRESAHFEAKETQAAQDAVEEGRLPTDARSVGIIILCLVAIGWTLYVGREVVLPLALALVLKLLLQPAMRFLHARLRLPQVLAAVLLILCVFGTIAAVGFTVSVPAANWIQKAPESLPLLKEKLAVLRQPIDYIQSAFKELGSIASPSGEGGQAVTVTQGGGLLGHVAIGTATTLTRFFTMIVCLFFLLASGDRLLRGLVEVLPRFKDKRQAVEIAGEIEENITGYLLTITMMNALVGIATGIAMQLCGLGDPVLWGVAAFLLNYIPILGPMCGIAMFLAAGIVSFDWPWWALVPAGIYLCIHIVEGETVTPMLLARRFTLNPVLVIVSLFVWHALWGIPGALLAVPLLAMAKIVCDRIDPLKPIGHIIGA
jgi:predicted PurR-regulated permease PerM